MQYNISLYCHIWLGEKNRIILMKLDKAKKTVTAAIKLFSNWTYDNYATMYIMYSRPTVFKPKKARKTRNAMDCATSSLLYYLLLYSVVLWILLQTNCCRLYFNMVSNTWLSIRKIRKIIKLYETVFFTGCLQVPSGRLSCYPKQAIIDREDVHSVGLSESSFSTATMPAT